MEYETKKFSDSLNQLIYSFGDKLAIEIQCLDNLFYAHNEHLPMPSASLIKLPILLYVLEQSRSSSELLNKEIHCPKSFCVGGSGVLQLLSQRDWSTRDLLALMISVSDNTATNLIIDCFGIASIQRWIEEQHFNETSLERKLMDNNAEKAGRCNRISAHDACNCMKRIFENTHYPKEIRNWFLHQQFRGKLPALFDETPSPIAVFNKTGEMESTDHDTAYFECKNCHLFLSVLTYGMDDRQVALNLIQDIGQMTANFLITLSAKSN